MRLKELRKEKKLTQSDIAKLLNVAPRTYGGYELEDSEPTIETLITLSNYYNVSIDFLVGRECKQINLLSLPENKREIFEVVLKLNDIETAKIHAYVSGFATAKNAWPSPLEKHDLNKNYNY